MINKKLKLKKWNFCLALFFLTVILLIVKQFVIYRSYKNLSPFKYCMEYLISDFYFLIIIAFFCTINFSIKNKVIKWISNIIISFLVLLFYIDIFTIYYFQSHETILSIVSILKFWWNWFTRIWIYWILAFIMAICICIFLSRYKQIQKFFSKIFSPGIFTICFILWVIVYFIQSIIFSIPISYTKNIVSINLQAVNNMINEDILLTSAKYEDYIKYEKWDGKDVNVILVFGESLSAVDSYHLWGKDNMPYLDKIQNDWITFNNFLSNWTNSSEAHVSTLIWAFSLRSAYKYSVDEWLAEFLNKQWYKTTFISTASLWFLDQRDFLERVWFQKIIWEEAFADKEKYSFNSAPDEYLYEKALEEIQNQTWKYFIWLQTISFHTPYSSPYSTPDGDDMLQTLKYADEKLYDFYINLQKIWFFDNWILIIVWDHRKPSRAELWESYIFWETRKYRSVATVVWTWIQPWSKNSNIIQHTDFYYSIKKLLWHWDVKLDTYYNNVFYSEKNREWWILKDEFTVLKWNEYRLLDVRSIKEKYRDIYDYYLAVKKHVVSEAIITKKLD